MDSVGTGVCAFLSSHKHTHLLFSVYIHLMSEIPHTDIVKYRSVVTKAQSSCSFIPCCFSSSFSLQQVVVLLYNQGFGDFVIFFKELCMQRLFREALWIHTQNSVPKQATGLHLFYLENIPNQAFFVWLSQLYSHQILFPIHFCVRQQEPLASSC